MQRRKRQMEGRVAATGGGGGCCRIRKRGCSSTSSSSLVHKGRVKRPILIARRTALRPLSSSPPARNDELLTHTPSRGGGNGKKAAAAAVSARKLAATLWETNEVPSPRPTSPPPSLTLEKKYQRRAGRMVARSQFVDLSDHSPDSKSMDPARTLTHRRRRRRTSPSSLSLLSFQGSDSSTSLLEIQCGGDDLAASRALLKVLGHVWGMEEQHTSSMSLVSALRFQLQQTRAKIDWLSREYRSAKNEITYLIKHFAEERAAWKRKERERIRDAVSSAARELEAEGKLRRCCNWLMCCGRSECR